jgi:hypothetical protein
MTAVIKNRFVSSNSIDFGALASQDWTFADATHNYVLAVCAQAQKKCGGLFTPVSSSMCQWPATGTTGTKLIDNWPTAGITYTWIGMLIDWFFPI